MAKGAAALNGKIRRIPNPAEKTEILSTHPLFGQIAPEIRDRLGAYAKTRNVPRGTVIFSKGDPGNSLFTICSGTVQIFGPSAAGKNVVFNLIREGEIFGEIALLDGGARTADAVAFTDCRLMVIERRDFLPVLRLYPDLAIYLLELLCARLRRTTEQVEDLMFLDLSARLVKTLLRMADAAKPESAVVLSQSELSQIVGFSREMINKQLQQWVKGGLIRLQRRRITIVDPDGLARVGRQV